MMKVSENSCTISEQSGLTRLTFDVSGDFTVSKKTISRINSCDDLLSVEVIERAGSYSFVYSADNLTCLSKYLRHRKVELAEATKILRGICSSVKRAKENGFYPDNFSYDSDHVFIDAQRMGMKMTLFPFETGQRADAALKALLSKLIDELMIFENDYSEYIQKIRDSYEQPRYSLAQLIILMDELDSAYLESAKKNKHKKKRTKIGGWSRFFGKKDKVPIQRSINNALSASAAPIQIPKLYSDTVLLIPNEETEQMPKKHNKSIQLLISINGENKQAKISDFPCVLGRSPLEANIVLEEISVSRKHAIIELIDNELTIADISSSNGVIHNNFKLQSGTKHQLFTGDTIKIGRIVIQVIEIDNK